MAKLFVLVAAVTLNACDEAPNLTDAQTTEREVEPARLPFDNSISFLDGYP